MNKAMNKLLLIIMIVISFTQVAAKNCEASCALGGHEKGMSKKHDCCEGKETVTKSCNPEYQSDDHHSCLHKTMSSTSMLEPTKGELSFKKDLLIGALIGIKEKKLNLLSNVFALEHIPNRVFQKFKRVSSIYIYQQKFLI